MRNDRSNTDLRAQRNLCYAWFRLNAWYVLISKFDTYKYGARFMVRREEGKQARNLQSFLKDNIENRKLGHK